MNTVKDIICNLRNSAMYNLSLSSKELFHSNFLAWLGNNPATKFYFAKVFNELIPRLNLQLNGNWTVEREDKHFDLCVKENGQYLLVIENKVKSIPNKSQLDEYHGKIHNNTHCLLLTLADDFPHKASISSEKIWGIKTYGELAASMNSNLIHSNLCHYEKAIIQDYILFISELDKLQQLWQSQPLFVQTYSTELEKISDLLEKITFSGYAAELQRKITQIGPHIFVFDDSIKAQLNHFDSNKVYIRVNWGYTNKKGLIDIAIPVSNLEKPKIIKGVVSYQYAVKIQVQGDNYRHVIETFDNSPVDAALINIGRSSEYTGARSFFTLDLLDETLPKPCFGNSHIFEPKIYPVNKGTAKNQIPPSHWPFASFKNRNSQISFIYQYCKINTTVTKNEVIENIVSEVKRLLKIFK